MNPEDLRELPGKVAIVGSLNADLTVRTPRIPNPGETVSGSPLEVYPGGKSANQAVTAGLLGADVELIGAVGKDANSLLLMNSLRVSDVHQTSISFLEVPTGTAIILVDENGENTIVISPGANGEVSPEMVIKNTQVIAEAATLGLCLEIPFPAVRKAAEIAKESNTKVVFNLSPVQEVPADFWELVDILLVNEHEAKQVMAMTGVDNPEVITPASDLEKIRAHFQKIGVKETIITLGEQGALVLAENEIRHLPSRTVEVVDTTGCGDSFMGTILAAVASDYTLVEAAEMAIIVSAYAARGKGAQKSYGRVKEIDDYFNPKPEVPWYLRD